MAVAFLLAAQPAEAQSVKASLAKAKKLTRQKKYPAAIEELKMAIQVNPQSAQAHWEMARVMATLRKTGKACEHGVMRSVIIRHLFKACRLYPKYKRRLRKEKLFRSLQDAFAWQGLVGLQVGSTDQTERILRAVTWYGPADASKKPAGGIDFRKRGRLVIWVRDEASELGRKDIMGRYQVRRQRVIVTLDKPLGETKKSEGELKMTGELWLPGLPGPFTDDPGECQQ